MNVAVTSNPVTASHETDAFVAPSANVTVSGPLVLHATSGNVATANSLDVSIGAVHVASLSASTNVAAATTAYVGNSAVLKGGNISLLADSTNNSAATQNSVGLSLLGAVKLDPVATDQHSVETYVGIGSTVTATGTLTLTPPRPTAPTHRPTARRGA